MTLKLVIYPDELLTRMVPVTVIHGQEGQYAHLQELAEKMIHAMYTYGGAGIAANQLGIRERMCVIQVQDEPVVLINPEIVEHSKTFIQKTESKPNEEGCLSFPGITANITTRWDYILVEYQSFTGATLRVVLNGDEARRAQHEIDHLNGITILDHVGNVQRGMLRKKYMKHHEQMKQFLKMIEKGK